MSLKKKARTDISLYPIGENRWALLMADEFEPELTFESRCEAALEVLGGNYQITRGAERLRQSAWIVELKRKPCPTCHRGW